MIRFLSEIQGKHTKLAKIVKISISFNRLVFLLKSNQLVNPWHKLHGDLYSKPLTSMLKKDNVFHWEEQQTWSFQQIKILIAKANNTPLRYYDRNLPVRVQVDALLRGLGACLI